MKFNEFLTIVILIVTFQVEAFEVSKIPYQNRDNLLSPNGDYAAGRTYYPDRIVVTKVDTGEVVSTIGQEFDFVMKDSGVYSYGIHSYEWVNSKSLFIVLGLRTKFSLEEVFRNFEINVEDKRIKPVFDVNLKGQAHNPAYRDQNHGTYFWEAACTDIAFKRCYHFQQLNGAISSIISCRFPEDDFRPTLGPPVFLAKNLVWYEGQIIDFQRSICSKSINRDEFRMAHGKFIGFNSHGLLMTLKDVVNDHNQITGVNLRMINPLNFDLVKERELVSSFNKNCVAEYFPQSYKISTNRKKMIFVFAFDGIGCRFTGVLNIDLQTLTVSEPFHSEVLEEYMLDRFDTTRVTIDFYEAKNGVFKGVAYKELNDVSVYGKVLLIDFEKREISPSYFDQYCPGWVGCSVRSFENGFIIQYKGGEIPFAYKFLI